MLPTLVDLVMVGSTLAGLPLLWVGFAVRRRYDEPGVDAFAVFCLLVGTTAVLTSLYGAAAIDPTGGSPDGGPSASGIWYQAVTTLLYLAPIPLGLFAVEYTGRSRHLDLAGPSKAGFAAVVAAVPVFIWFEYAWVTLGPFDLPMTFVVGYLGVRIAATLFSLAVYFCAVAITVYSTYVSDYLGTVQGLSLTAGWTVPLAMIWITMPLLGARDPTFNLVGYGTVGCAFAFCSAATYLSVEWYGAFENTPAAGEVGREALIEEMDDLVVVVDHHGRVSELNPAAVETLGEGSEDPINEPVDSLLGLDLDQLRSTDTVELTTIEGRRQFDPQVSDLEAGDGRGLGGVVTLRDVTRREIREQRLAVLNRVLRHNLRNKLAIVKGSADVITDGEGSSDAADKLGEAADDLIDLGEQARTIERLMRESESEDVPVPLRVVVEDVVGEVAADHPDVRFETRVDDGLVLRGEEGLFRHALASIVENGAEHNTAARPLVRVTVAVDDADATPVTISVTDNGPGIPEDERAVIRDGTETPLEHASGLGLWAASWCTRRLGGRISFGESRLGGARVVVELPEESPSHTVTAIPGGAPATASGD